ncbi:hypothetical protein [Cryobacterium aureum]|uniref:hypothetical protein n=1 Tax=Cryobacterium aureum TaxID=995037 RepID=UPI000CF378F2|nr:hypothetical protein [Cryobacterium aureum]
MSTSTDRQILAHVRLVTASRAGLPTASDAVYTVYVAVLIVAIVAVPVVRSIVLGLASPEILSTIVAPDSYRGVGAIAAVLAACALLIGRTRGLAVPSPFLIEFLAGSHLARSDTLRRPILFSVTVLALAAVTVSGIVVGARFLGGPTAAIPAALILLGSIAYSGVLAVLWLMGQSCPRPTTIPLAIVILGSAVAAAAGADIVMLASPWGWLALLWASLDPAAPVLWWPALTLALSPLVFLAAPALLNNLRSPELMAQARRWQSIGTLVQTGDIAGASGALRTPPARGRRYRISFTGPLPIAILQRDIGTARRFPVRITFGSLALVVAGWLNAQTDSAQGGLDWVVALAGVLLAYLAAGVWCDGLRNANENVGPSSLYGRSALTMIGSHALLPGLACLLLGSIGTIAAVAGGAAIGVLPWWMLVSVFIVLVRILDCAKGPMPIGLLLPIVTPVGDVSILNVIAWQADALIIVLATAGGLSVLFSTAGPEAAVWLTAGIGIVAALAGRRIRALGA